MSNRLPCPRTSLVVEVDFLVAHSRKAASTTKNRDGRVGSGMRAYTQVGCAIVNTYIYALLTLEFALLLKCASHSVSRKPRSRALNLMHKAGEFTRLE